MAVNPEIALAPIPAMVAGNPTLPPLLEWEQAWTTRLIITIVMTAVFIAGVVMFFSIGSLKEITENFPRYRCNPMIMPFASNFGYDTKENFNFCLGNIFKVKAAEVFGPIYKLLEGFTNILKLIVDVVLGIRKLFSNFLLGVNGFVRNVRDRIQGLLFSIRLSFIKMNNLMGKVYGTMFAVIWMGTSAVTAGMSVADNDLVKFLFEFCFDPSTPVELEDGTYKAIGDVSIGDRLAPIDGAVPRVTSLLRFDGSRTPMVSIHGTIISREHYVSHDSKMIPAYMHPDAIPSSSLHELVCLNVSGHKFKVGNGLVVADYDEHDAHHVIQEAQRIALQTLNNRRDANIRVPDSYHLGIDPSFEIRMEDGSWKPVRNVELNARVWNGGRVLGIVDELCPRTVRIDDLAVSESQTLFVNNAWTRAASSRPDDVADDPQILRAFVTETCGTLHIRSSVDSYYIRDYREVAVPEMEAPYAAAF